MLQPTLELYIDDSGSRNPSHAPNPQGGKDAFALGGFVVREEDRGRLEAAHAKLIREFAIIGPLQSNRIRAGKGEFIWLKKEPERASGFFSQLDKIFVTAPIHVAACVVDRPGYNARYQDYGNTDRWHLCRSAYYILVERVAKHALREGCRLRIFVEATGRKEDSKIREYHKDLLRSGVPFDRQRSSAYEPLSPDDFQKVMLQKPIFVKKNNPVMQLADLMLFPAVAGGYNPDYRTYQLISTHKKILQLPLTGGRSLSGIKYYCFGGHELPESQ